MRFMDVYPVSGTLYHLIYQAIVRTNHTDQFTTFIEGQPVGDWMMLSECLLVVAIMAQWLALVRIQRHVWIVYRAGIQFDNVIHNGCRLATMRAYITMIRHHLIPYTPPRFTIVELMRPPSIVHHPIPSH